VIKLIIQISKGLIRDPHTRRAVMFYTVLAALVMLFLGATFLWHLLVLNKWIFILYWFACAWITILAAGLALFDLLMVRAEGRRARKRLEAEIMRGVRNQGDDHRTP
jgi:predicted membrane protein